MAQDQERPANEAAWYSHSPSSIFPSSHTFHYFTNKCSAGPTVLFIHGLPGHREVGFQRDAARYLAKEGIAQSVRYDLDRNSKQWERSKDNRGLLGSIAQLKSFSYVTFQDHCDDLLQRLQHTSSSQPERPIILAAHSYGAMLALYAVAHTDTFPDITGVFLSNPFITKSFRHHFLSGFEGMPNPQQSLEHAASYNGSIAILYDQYDQLVPSRNNAIQILRSRQSAGLSTQSRIYNSVRPDHDFIKPDSREKYVSDLAEFVKSITPQEPNPAA